ncbi:hypothetical protein CFIMG_007286RA00001 [Ceratocystis fimbriata CBS 114723]|uniref:C2H2-type domain-containing protein n=1 Tax=Ceratocystis fimbriata CBS 114723 TaxID=1035309 RepID=A0A2C5XFE4_9PEZI|nr:hypothetical protein CFIMG_007286RA00001 [Ceratocystis fimbriata CBS 114723]
MAPEAAFKSKKFSSLKDVGDIVGVYGSNGGYHQHSADGGGSKKRPLCIEPSALSRETANSKRRKQQPNRQKPSKRPTSNNDDSDGSDDDGIDPDGHEAGSHDMPFFVCPYARRYPTKHKSCWNKTLHNMNRVRQHILRYHAHCCDVCKECFTSKKKLTKHKEQNEQRTSHSCKPRSKWPGYIEGPDSELSAQIRTTRRGQSPADQYSELYSLIFGPEHQDNKIPYFCPHPPLIEAFVQYLLINSSLLRLENLQESAHTQALLQRILEALETTDRANTRSQGSTQQMLALPVQGAPGPCSEVCSGIPELGPILPGVYGTLEPMFGLTPNHDLHSSELGYGILPPAVPVPVPTTHWITLDQASASFDGAMDSRYQLGSATGDAYQNLAGEQMSNGVEPSSMFDVVEQNEVDEFDLSLFTSSASQEDTDAEFQERDLA